VSYLPTAIQEDLATKLNLDKENSKYDGKMCRITLSITRSAKYGTNLRIVGIELEKQA